MKYLNGPTCTILNVQVDNLSMSEVISQIHYGFIVTPNVDHLVQLQKDEEFFNAYQSADYQFCDSQILIQISRLYIQMIGSTCPGTYGKERED